jgi:predicted acyltransferase
MIYNGFLKFDFENMRYASVLARIGIAWFFGALIVMHSQPKWWYAWLGGILLAYWGMMALIPVPGYGAGNYTLEGSLAAYIDRLLLPGVLYLKVHDPEGILSTFPAIATALMGSITGNFLLKPDQSIPRIRKFYIIAAAGAAALFAGWLWGQVFPINKNLWTSSFVLFAGGISLLFLALFYLIIDVWGFKRWSFFFVVIGMNAITIYLLQAGIFNFWDTTEFFFGGLADKLNSSWGALINSIGYVSIVWLLLYVLYKKKIFLRV